MKYVSIHFEFTHKYLKAFEKDCKNRVFELLTEAGIWLGLTEPGKLWDFI